MNRLQKSPEWKSTAVVVAYDDSDGWYDHQPSPVVNASTTPDDALNGPGECTHTPAGGATSMLAGIEDRCGYGPRLPLLVMSPYARSNSIDHAVTDQSSILRFVEDNWLRGARISGSYDQLAGTLDGLFRWDRPRNARLFLDPVTGAPMGQRARQDDQRPGRRSAGHS